MSQDRNIKAVEIVSEIYNMSPEEREKKLMEYTIETYLTIKDHDIVLSHLPCQDNGILRFFAAMSTTKRVFVSMIGFVMLILTAIGCVLGLVGYFKGS